MTRIHQEGGSILLKQNKLQKKENLEEKKQEKRKTGRETQVQIIKLLECAIPSALPA